MDPEPQELMADIIAALRDRLVELNVAYEAGFDVQNKIAAVSRMLAALERRHGATTIH